MKGRREREKGKRWKERKGESTKLNEKVIGTPPTNEWPYYFIHLVRPLPMMPAPCQCNSELEKKNRKQTVERDSFNFGFCLDSTIL